MAGWRHIFFVTDLEGVAGIDSWDQTRNKGPRHEEAKALATAEVNGVVRALLGRREDSGRSPLRISVWDGHGYGGLVLDRLDERVTSYRHDDVRGFTGLLRQSLLGPSPVDALGFIGQHAMEGSGGTLSHTYSSRRVRRYTLNGRAIGEFGIRSLYAWELARIPTVFVSGDDVTCREAQTFVPGVIRAQVKVSHGLTSARHLGPEESCARLASEAVRILELNPADRSLRPALVPEPPWEFRKQFKWKFGLVPRPPRTLRGESLVGVLEQV